MSEHERQQSAQQPEPPKPERHSPPQRCPRCQQMTGRLLFGEERRREEHHDLPEGLSGVTPVECQNPECQETWEVVTHSQILHSLKHWTGGRPIERS